MTLRRAAVDLMCVCLCVAGSLQAQPIIEETFTGYRDNVLISADPAGPAVGLVGNWVLVPNSEFYVNKTQADDAAATGWAAYDRSFDDNGTRTATRKVEYEPVLYETDGDVFYAAFVILTPSDTGDMTFELELVGLDGGSVDLSFGISGGAYVVGHGGLSNVAGGGLVMPGKQLVVLRVEYGDTASGGADDLEVFTLWVDPVDESSVPVIAGFTGELLETGGGSLASVSIRGDQMDGQPALFDELRVGLSFADVLPEPELVFADGFESAASGVWSWVGP